MNDEKVYHLIPAADINPHDISWNCWCSPKAHEDNKNLIVHVNSSEKDFDDEKDN